MRNILKVAVATALASSVLAIAGCSSDDSISAPAVPANAVTITEDNAAPLVASATLTVTTLIGVEATPTPADIMQIIDDRLTKARTTPNTSGMDPVLGVVFDDTYDCSISGSVNESGSYTDNGTSGSGSGIDTYTNCEDYTDVFLNGTINYSFSWSEPTWNDTANGSLTMTALGETISITGITFAENGNDTTDDYTTTIFSFTVDPVGGGGFSVQLGAPITGNEWESCPNSPDGGIILLTGAGGSQARATINSNGTVTVEAGTGGVFTEVADSPFACSYFFY